VGLTNRLRKPIRHLADNRQFVTHRCLPCDIKDKLVAVPLREVHVDSIRGLDDVEQVETVRPHTASV
jgi:hypothetical protein